MSKLLIINREPISNNFVHCSGPRNRLPGEITPVKAEHSSTFDNNEAIYAAQHAIDLEWGTRSKTISNQDGSWFELKLKGVHCVTKVIWYTTSENDTRQIWTCSGTKCTCSSERNSCSDFNMTISTAETYPTGTGCIYGDTLQLKEKNKRMFFIYEIAVVGKQSKQRLYTHVQLHLILSFEICVL